MRRSPRTLATAVIALAAVCQAQDASTTIDTETLGVDAYRLILKSYRSRSVADAQKELAPKARELCGPRHAEFGKYTFESTEPLDAGAAAVARPFVLGQELRCVEALSLPPPAPPAPATGSIEQNDSLVIAKTIAYFVARDEGRDEHAYSMMTPAQKATLSLDRWKSLSGDFRRKAGEFHERRIRKVTWYTNPPNAAPGTYGAVDYSTDYEKLAFHCGYVVWYSPPGGTFLLMREEQSMLDKETAAKIDPVRLEQLKRQMRC